MAEANATTTAAAAAANAPTAPTATATATVNGTAAAAAAVTSEQEARRSSLSPADQAYEARLAAGGPEKPCLDETGGAVWCTDERATTESKASKEQADHAAWLAEHAEVSPNPYNPNPNPNPDPHPTPHPNPDPDPDPTLT